MFDINRCRELSQCWELELLKCGSRCTHLVSSPFEMVVHVARWPGTQRHGVRSVEIAGGTPLRIPQKGCLAGSAASIGTDCRQSQCLARNQIPESRIREEESRIKNPESRSGMRKRDRESGLFSLGSGLLILDSRCRFRGLGETHLRRRGQGLRSCRRG